jgi:hypothetical protein
MQNRVWADARHFLSSIAMGGQVEACRASPLLHEGENAEPAKPSVPSHQDKPIRVPELSSRNAKELLNGRLLFMASASAGWPFAVTTIIPADTRKRRHARETVTDTRVAATLEPLEISGWPCQPFAPPPMPSA